MYTYKFFINSEDESEFEDTIYSFEMRKLSARIKIIENKIFILFKINTIYKNWENMINIAKEPISMIEKVLIIYNIIFSNNIHIQEIKLYKGIRQPRDISGEINNEINSLVNNQFDHPFPEDWRGEHCRDWIENFLNDDDKKKGTPYSSLNALIIAKNKKYEIEKFQHLWIAMNGMYGYFHKIIKSIAESVNMQRINNTPIKNYPEYMQISDFCTLNGWFDDDARNVNWQQSKRIDKTIEKKEAPMIKKRIYPILLNKIREMGRFDIGLLDIEGVEETLKNELYTEKTTNGTRLGYRAIFPISVCGYLTIRLPYQYRCEYFHANEPIPIFNFENRFSQKSNKIFKLLNNIMEDYIENELLTWFTVEGRRRLENGARNILGFPPNGNDQTQPAAQQNADGD